MAVDGLTNLPPLSSQLAAAQPGQGRSPGPSTGAPPRSPGDGAGTNDPSARPGLPVPYDEPASARGTGGSFAELPPGRVSSPFLAQLIAQADDRQAVIDGAVARLRQRRQTATDPGTSSGRDPAGDLNRPAIASERSAEAYRRVAETSRDFAAARYGLIRDERNLYVFGPGIVDLSV